MRIPEEIADATRPNAALHDHWMNTWHACREAARLAQQEAQEEIERLKGVIEKANFELAERSRFNSTARQEGINEGLEKGAKVADCDETCDQQVIAAKIRSLKVP